jgi:hypothetical protein
MRASDISFQSDEKGRYGEDRARVFLRSRFNELTDSPSPDRGTDIICVGPRWLSSLLAESMPVVRFQIKSGLTYHRGFSIRASILDHILRRIETEPVIWLYYEHATQPYVFPDSFLVLNTWILCHLDEVRMCLATEKQLRISHDGFQRLRNQNDLPLRAAVADELRRATSHRGHLLAPRHDQLPEYSYVRDFAKVTRVWDIGLWPAAAMRRVFNVAHPSELRERLLRATESERALSKLFSETGRSKKHPLHHTPPRELEESQAVLYRALIQWGTGKEFQLPRRFTVSESAAARAMSAKYPNLMSVVEQVLREWRKRPLSEILTATQALAVLSQYGNEAEDQAVRVLRSVIEQVRHRPIRNLGSFQLLYHLYVALAESTGEKSPARKAVDLAVRFVPWQLQHLRDYGWGVGPHLIDLYSEAAADQSLRGARRREYNQGMLELVGNMFS